MKQYIYYENFEDFSSDASQLFVLRFACGMYCSAGSVLLSGGPAAPRC